jgi:hypothetical protein
MIDHERLKSVRRVSSSANITVCGAILEGYICEKMDLAIHTYATQMTFGADSSDEFHQS